MLSIASDESGFRRKFLNRYNAVSEMNDKPEGAPITDSEITLDEKETFGENF